jgi:transposase
MPKGQKVDLEQLRSRRLEAKRLLDEGLSQAEVARRLDVSRQSLTRWARTSAKKLGVVSPLGRKSSADEQLRERLREALLAGAEKQGYPNSLWTLPRVRSLIVKLGGPSFSTVHVWRILGQMGFTPQRPVGRARERNEAAVAQWKQDWPALKKKRPRSAGPSSSSTKAD